MKKTPTMMLPSELSAEIIAAVIALPGSSGKVRTVALNKLARM
jgi:hypothetical protein